MDDEEQKTQEENLKQIDINDWQAQRLLSRSMLRQIMQEMVDEEMRDPDRTALSGHQDGNWQFQLHNATIPDEAWHVKRVADQDGRIAELQRYVARVVQYVSYCIWGRHADQFLAKIKGCKFSELLRRYDDCLKLMKWEEHNPFLEAQLIEALTLATILFWTSRKQCMTNYEFSFSCRPMCVMKGSRILCFVPLQRSSSRMQAQDSQPPDTIGVGLGHSYKRMGNTEMLKNSTKTVLNFYGVGTRLGAGLANRERGTTFHIFWSPRDSGGRPLDQLQNEIVALRDIIKSIICQDHVPYVCLDMVAMEEWEARNF
jgi:hypothetical protein